MQLKSRWYRASIVTLLSLVSFLASCDNQGSIPPEVLDMFGIVSGQILVDGEGFAGLNVSISTSPARVTQSDASGSFSFTDVEVGDYTVTISGQSAEITFSTQALPAKVVGRQTTTLAFSGTIIRTSSITGSVLLDGTGEEGRGVELTGVESRTTETDAGGQFSFTGLRMGTYTVALSGVDNTVRFTNASTTVVLGIGEAGTADFSGIREIFATGRIKFIEDVTTGARLGFNTIAGDVEVVVAVDGGTRTLTALRVRFRGNLVGELDLSGAAAASSSSVDYRIPFNTTVFDANTGTPTLTNGPGVLSLEIETAEDGAFEVDTDNISLTNRDQIGGLLFVTAETDPGVVSQGRTWYGNKDLEFKVVPVLYSTDVVIGSVEVEAISTPSANGTGAMDFGSGPGAPHRVMGPDFTFTATAALNRDVVEDSPSGDGHRVVVRRVFDSNGVDISQNVIRSASLNGLYIDFTGPVAGPVSIVLVDGAVLTPNRWYNTGALTVRDISEEGIGGLSFSIDAVVAGVTVQQGVTNLDDLLERKQEYQLKPGTVTDMLGNQTAVGGVAPTVAFGIDRTPMTITGVAPTQARIINPTDDVADGTTDNQLQFTLTDPVLADGTPGAGFASVTLMGTNQDDVDFDLTPRILPSGTGPNQVNLSGAIPDGTYSFTLVTTDATLGGNTSTQTFDFTVDDTPPLVTLNSFPPGAVTPSGSAIGFSIGGIITEANGLLSATLVVRDAGGNAECDLTDAVILVGSGPGQVDLNSVDILDEASNFSQIFGFTRLPSTAQVVCLWVEAKDISEDVDGNAEPNVSRTFTLTTINWN
jgi:hypothetical protein